MPEIEVVVARSAAGAEGARGELSGALAEPGQAHAVTGQLASGVERAVVLLVRAASKVSQSQGRPLKQRGGTSRRGPAGPSGSPEKRRSLPPSAGQVQRGPRLRRGHTNGDTPPWLTSAGTACAFGRHRPASRLGPHRGHDPESAGEPGQGRSRDPGQLFRLFRRKCRRGQWYRGRCRPRSGADSESPQRPDRLPTQPGPPRPGPGLPSTTATEGRSHARTARTVRGTAWRRNRSDDGQTIAAQLRRHCPGSAWADGGRMTAPPSCHPQPQSRTGPRRTRC